jgi:hypothetical protein
LGSVDRVIVLRGVRDPMEARLPEYKTTAGSSRAPAPAVIPQSPCPSWPASCSGQPTIGPVLARQTTQLTGNTRPPRKWFNSAPRNLDAPVVEPALVGPRPATPQTTHCPTTGELSAARDRQTPLHGEPAVTATPQKHPCQPSAPSSLWSAFPTSDYYGASAMPWATNWPWVCPPLHWKSGRRAPLEHFEAEGASRARGPIASSLDGVRYCWRFPSLLSFLG